jgi:hypothetical protein
LNQGSRSSVRGWVITRILALAASKTSWSQSVAASIRWPTPRRRLAYTAAKTDKLPLHVRGRMIIAGITAEDVQDSMVTTVGRDR